MKKLYKGWKITHAGTRKRGTMWKAKKVGSERDKVNWKDPDVLAAPTKEALFKLIDDKEVGK